MYQCIKASGSKGKGDKGSSAVSLALNTLSRHMDQGYQAENKSASKRPYQDVERL